MVVFFSLYWKHVCVCLRVHVLSQLEKNGLVLEDFCRNCDVVSLCILTFLYVLLTNDFLLQWRVNSNEEYVLLFMW